MKRKAPLLGHLTFVKVNYVVVHGEAGANDLELFLLFIEEEVAVA